MAEEERLETIAKEMTITAWQSTVKPADPTPESVGNAIGKLYKTIMKNVIDAYDHKYD